MLPYFFHVQVDMTVLPKDLATTLRQRYREKHHAEQHRAIALRSMLVEHLQRAKFENVRIWLIGSLQADYWGAHSDVDLVVDGLDVNQAATLQKNLAQALDVDVDLMRMELLPTSFRERVTREGELLIDVSS